ncbi:hypothetical protein ACFX13_002513 [Malus domestica]
MENRLEELSVPLRNYLCLSKSGIRGMGLIPSLQGRQKKGFLVLLHASHHLYNKKFRYFRTVKVTASQPNHDIEGWDILFKNSGSREELKMVQHRILSPYFEWNLSMP